MVGFMEYGVDTMSKDFLREQTTMNELNEAMEIITDHDGKVFRSTKKVLNEIIDLVADVDPFKLTKEQSKLFGEILDKRDEYERLIYSLQLEKDGQEVII